MIPNSANATYQLELQGRLKPMVYRVAGLQREMAISTLIDLFLPEVAAYGQRLWPYIADIIQESLPTSMTYEQACIYASLLALLSEYTCTVQVSITVQSGRKRLVQLANPDWSHWALRYLDRFLEIGKEAYDVEVPEDPAAGAVEVLAQ